MVNPFFNPFHANIPFLYPQKTSEIEMIEVYSLEI